MYLTCSLVHRSTTYMYLAQYLMLRDTASSKLRLWVRYIELRMTVVA